MGWARYSISRGEREEMRIYNFRLIYDLTNNKHVKQKLVSSDVDRSTLSRRKELVCCFNAMPGCLVDSWIIKHSC